MTIKVSPQFFAFLGLLAAVFAAPAPATALEPAPLPAGCQLAGMRPHPAIAVTVPEAAFPPTQLQIRVPVDPALLPSGEFKFLIYELHLQNFGGRALNLEVIDVSGSSGAAQKPVVQYGAADLKPILHHVGFDSANDRAIRPGGTVVAFLCIAFGRNVQVPDQLRHRIVLADAVIDGPAVAVNRARVPVLGRPLVGTDWNPRNGPHAGSHHRTGLFVSDGLATISRRYAIDWRKSRQGTSFSGDPRDVRSYFSYGEKVLAVADGTVVFSSDGMPDNIPKTDAGFEPAVPLTMDNIAGNAVVIDVGGGHLASYSHLQAASVQVRAGERVRQGQLIGRVGNSGDARWPHLHFQVSGKPNPMAGEGEAFVIGSYRQKSAGGKWETRTEEFPWGDSEVIDFGPDASAIQSTALTPKADTSRTIHPQ